MKKIVALVLTVVLALSLATVAFADDDPVTKTVAGKEYTQVQAPAANNGHAKDAIWEKDNLYYYIDEDLNVTKLTDAQKIALEAGYYSDLALYSKAAAATCKDGGTLCNVYTDGLSYFVTEADYKANKTSLTNATKVYVGDDGLNVTAYYALVGASKDDALATVTVGKGHAFYKTAEKFGASEQAVYQCAVCGLKVVIDPDGDSTKNLTKVTVTTNADAADILADAGIALSKAAAIDTVVYQVAAAGTTTSGVTSAKTFDAGVALYAGMALMSVAGSAVVIGKKKEF